VFVSQIRLFWWSIKWNNCCTSMMMPVRSHFFEWWSFWFWNLTLLPIFSGDRALVCLLHLSCWSMWWCLSASSLKFRESLQVGCGWHFPGRIGIRSLIGLPKTHMAGEILVVGSVLEDGFLECVDVIAPSFPRCQWSNFWWFWHVSQLCSCCGGKPRS